VRQVHDARSVEVFEALLGGRSAAEVAASFGLSVDAVYKVKQRIRDQLKDLVARQVRDEDEPDGRPGRSAPRIAGG
jgi:DNA-directed RNA polymerase specialized sigma24 family protein